jgi:hypothetical protein
MNLYRREGDGGWGIGGRGECFVQFRCSDAIMDDKLARDRQDHEL